MNQDIPQEILDHLRQDSIMSNIISNCTLMVHKKPIAVFDDLVRSIVSQQLSTTAASTIHGRFEGLLDPNDRKPNQILSKSIEELRSVGLSNAKAQYIKNCAQHFDDNALHHVDWNMWTDEEIIEELTKIKGVGKWTVEMILMFSLHREDVFPYDDLIIRNNIIKLYNIKAEKKELIATLNTVAESWRPYRSIACRYIWAAKDMNLLFQ